MNGIVRTKFFDPLHDHIADINTPRLQADKHRITDMLIILDQLLRKAVDDELELGFGEEDVH